ncbi:MAG: hypothetical protein AAF360_12945 [Pseudomonadota bacterium]
MPGQLGDRPQSRSLIDGLDGVGHIIADAAYGAHYLRQFIVEDLGATAQIKRNPRRLVFDPGPSGRLER